MRQPLPLTPVKTCKSALQVLYSALKPGVEGATQYLAQLRSATQRYSWTQKVVIDTLFCVATNAVLLSRMLHVDTDERPGLDVFRQRCSRRRNFVDTMTALCTRLIGSSGLNRHPRRGNEGSSSTSSSGYRPPVRNRRQFFNSTPGRNRRLSSDIAHDVGVLRRQQRCVVCGLRTTRKCTGCSGQQSELRRVVPLCVKRRDWETRSCFSMFHTVQTIPANVQSDRHGSNSPGPDQESDHESDDSGPMDDSASS